MRAPRAMCSARSGVGSSDGGRSLVSVMSGSAQGSAPGEAPGTAPSVAEPERFRRGLPAAYSFGEPRERAAAFQSVILLRSFCLSVSGAVAPSAPDWTGLSRRTRLIVAVARQATVAAILFAESLKSTRGGRLGLRRRLLLRLLLGRLHQRRIEADVDHVGVELPAPGQGKGEGFLVVHERHIAPPRRDGDRDRGALGPQRFRLRPLLHQGE